MRSGCADWRGGSRLRRYLCPRELSAPLGCVGRGLGAHSEAVDWRVERPVMYRQIDGLGAPSVTSVLDDAIVGDNNLDWVTPCEDGTRSAQCYKADQHEDWRARRSRELSTARP